MRNASESDKRTRHVENSPAQGFPATGPPDGRAPDAPRAVNFPRPRTDKAVPKIVDARTRVCAVSQARRYAHTRRFSRSRAEGEVPSGRERQTDRVRAYGRSEAHVCVRASFVSERARKTEKSAAVARCIFGAGKIETPIGGPGEREEGRERAGFINGREGGTRIGSISAPAHSLRLRRPRVQASLNS